MIVNIDGSWAVYAPNAGQVLEVYKTKEEAQAASLRTPPPLEELPIFTGKTKLDEPEEKKFQAWYLKEVTKGLGLAPNPDDPLHNYDYRALWEWTGGKKLEVEEGKPFHFQSWFKTEGHTDRFKDGIDTITDESILKGIKVP